MHTRFSSSGLLLSLLVWGLGGCASPSNFTPTLSFKDFPTEGEETTVEIGSPLVYKAKVSEFDGIALLEPVTAKGTGINLGARFEFEPSEFIATESDATRVYFHAVDPTKAKYYALGMNAGELKTKNQGKVEVIQMGKIGISENQKTGALEAFFLQGNLVARASIPSETRLKRTKLTKKDAPGFRQELLYNGKSGETIKVLYREFQDDMARPAFTQDLTYDLSESDVIGFQGVRIRVTKATNTAITYTVLRHFPTVAP